MFGLNRVWLFLPYYYTRVSTSRYYLDLYPPPHKLNTRMRKLTMLRELIVVEFVGVLQPLLGLPTAILVVHGRVVVRYCRGRRLLHGSAPGPQLSAPHSTLCRENKLSLPLPPHNTYTTLTITLYSQCSKLFNSWMVLSCVFGCKLKLQNYNSKKKKFF